MNTEQIMKKLDNVVTKIENGNEDRYLLGYSQALKDILKEVANVAINKK